MSASDTPTSDVHDGNNNNRNIKPLCFAWPLHCKDDNDLVHSIRLCNFDNNNNIIDVDININMDETRIEQPRMAICSHEKPSFAGQ